MKKGKKYQENFKLIQKQEIYSLKDGLEMLKKISVEKFDASVDVAFRLGLQQKHSIRGSFVLPVPIHKKEIRILAFVEGDQVKSALDAGAMYAGLEELMDKIKGGWLEFDVVLATPSVMKKIVSLGSVLGRRGLMPNPKVGTVSENIEQAIQEFKKGRMEYRNDKSGIIHSKLGRVSMDVVNLVDNFEALYGELIKKKPSDLKGDYVKSVYISSSMSPSIKIAV